ncbi:MAG TPA: DNA translocase FtsK [Pseudogracilibacillus sp.]|nr:DNA translocase FtsK [Pseudogracilibacillus sp.]
MSNFFFEEVREAADVEEEKKALPFEEDPEAKNRSIHTKVTYQYPPEQPAPFRFPVIPDNDHDKQQLISAMTDRKQVTRIRKRNDRPQKRVEREDLIFGYKRQKKVKELEDVPAYIRRRKEAPPETDTKRDIESSNEVLDPLAGTTRPDELDRVFRKRDGKEQNQIDKDQATYQDTKEKHLKNHPEINDTSHTTNTEKAVEKSISNDTTLSEHKELLHSELTEKKKDPLSLNKTIEKNVIEQTEKLNTTTEEHNIPVPNYLLNDPIDRDQNDTNWLQEQQLLLDQTLKHFKVHANIVRVTQGPSVTRFEIQPELGVKVSRIRNLADDIKLNMAAKDIRIEAPIPGKNTVGIEVPNQYPQIVTLQEIIESDAFEKESSPLTIALGLTIEGKPLITDIAKMPHGLIAGATGSGKSVCINTIILSLLYKANMNEVKFLLIDPKMVELTPYNGIPHLISPVITDPQAATMALKWAVNEMEERYERFVEAGVRNIVKYNEKMVKENKQKHKMPYIVIVIDELADLMLVSPQEVEDAICRIAQKARACGIHLLLATQRPSVDVITGLIKANIPTRIAFSVSSQVDSRTIIDANGAEKLLGKGDMLFVENGTNRMRLQGPFVSDEEIDRVANYLRSMGKPNYLFEQEQLLIEVENEEQDELLNDVISFVLEENQASTSLLQRRFRIGYNRAARLIDTLQNKGIVSAQNGSKPREVLVTKAQIEELN